MKHRLAGLYGATAAVSLGKVTPLLVLTTVVNWTTALRQPSTHQSQQTTSDVAATRFWESGRLLLTDAGHRASFLDSGVKGASAQAVINGGSSIFMSPAPAPMGMSFPIGVSLVPDFTTMQWKWAIGDEAMYTTPQIVPMGLTLSMPPVAGMPPAPAPAPAAGPSPGPSPGPAAKPDPCGKLIAAGQQSYPGQFLNCEEFRYYGDSVLGSGTPYGCQCGSWSIACPFATCRVEKAWDESCLEPAATALGFNAISKASHVLPGDSLPPPMTGFTHKPGIISMCMYWLPKPGPVAMPPVPNPGQVLPVYANLKFLGATVTDCVKSLDTIGTLEQTKAALVAAIKAPGLTVVSLDCGIFNALVQGPPNSVKMAQAVTAAPGFCFSVPATLVHICSAPIAAPGPGPYPGPGPHPGPAPAPAR